MDLGAPPISSTPIAKNTEYPKFFKDGYWKQEQSSANSTIFGDLQVSSNFGISKRKSRLNSLLPISAYKMRYLY